MDKPAIHGGPQSCPAGTLPVWPMHDQQESRALERVLASGRWWRVPGEEVDHFEREFSDFHGAAHALGVATGSQALELGLACVDVGPGDEVIVPAFTFAATASAVLALGAIPVAVDVDPGTLCLDPMALERAITPHTRAFVPVHMAGHPCDMDRLADIARRHSLRVVVDAAHAQGARWAGRGIAAGCDAAIFSFQAFKLLTAGEGGALLTDDSEIARRAWLKHSCGRPRGDRLYQHVELGTNMRMTEFQGALLRAQLSRFPEQLNEREEAARRLTARLSQFQGLVLPCRHPSVTVHSQYMFMVGVNPDACGMTRDEFVQALVAEGIPAYRAYRAIPDLELFTGKSIWGGVPGARPSAEAVRAAIGRHAVPVSRHVAEHWLWLHHTVLLGGNTVQDAVASGFEKIMAWQARAAPLRESA